MHVLSVSDLEQPDAVKAVTRIRIDANKVPIVPDDVQETVNTVGGRLSYLNRVSYSAYTHALWQMFIDTIIQVAKAKNMTEMAKHMLRVEKGWILSQIGVLFFPIFTSRLNPHQ
jgi:hypothetical protein